MNNSRVGDSISYQKRIKVIYWITLLLGLFGFLSIIGKSFMVSFDAPLAIWVTPAAVLSIVLINLFGVEFFNSFLLQPLSIMFVLWPLWLLMAYSTHRVLKKLKTIDSAK